MTRTVLIVAYGRADDLRRCLMELDRSSPILVVDNSSSPEVRAVATEFGAVYLDAGGNLGFAAGVNVGLRSLAAEPPDSVLLLNPDAAIGPAGLDELGRFLDDPSHERIAAVAPRLRGADGDPQRVVWPFPTPWRAWLEAVGLGRLPSSRTFVVGAVLLVRWSAIREVGLFDERFFLYSEETDWMRRALDLGWGSAVCAAAVADHLGAGTSEDGDRREAFFHAGQETYIRKWYGRSGWLIYRGAAGSGAAARALVLSGQRRRDALRRLRIYLRGPRRCAGLVSE